MVSKRNHHQAPGSSAGQLSDCIWIHHKGADQFEMIAKRKGSTFFNRFSPRSCRLDAANDCIKSDPGRCRHFELVASSNTDMTRPLGAIGVNLNVGGPAGCASRFRAHRAAQRILIEAYGGKTRSRRVASETRRRQIIAILFLHEIAFLCNPSYRLAVTVTKSTCRGVTVDLASVRKLAQRGAIKGATVVADPEEEGGYLVLVVDKNGVERPWTIARSERPKSYKSLEAIWSDAERAGLNEVKLKIG